MSHGLAPNDEKRQLYKEAREALSRVEFTNKDWYWLRSTDQLAGRRTFTKPLGAASTGASLALDAHERMLMIEALRKTMGPESLEVPFRVEVGGPLSLTLGEWLSIREELLRYFFETGGEHGGHKLERLIARIEDLIASEQAPNGRAEGQAARPRLVRRSRPFRFRGPRIRSPRELGLAMQLADEGPLSASMLHADRTLLDSLARRGLIAIQPGSGEQDAVWTLTAEGRSETNDCRRLYLDWLGRVHAKNPVWHRTGGSHPT